MQLYKILLSVLFLAVSATNLFSETPALQREALVALYDNADGTNWSTKTNWLSDDPCGNDWHGVTCDENDNISSLHLYENNLTGKIPIEIGNLIYLEGLYLFFNQLTGAIPSEIGNLTNLNRLYLDHNQLSGVIPPEIGNLTNLEYLHLNNNRLTGSIPTEVGSLTNLTRLFLSTNQLTKSIPTEIWNLTNLYNIHLENNQLTGTIPTEIGNLINLYYLYLNDNCSLNSSDSSVQDFIVEKSSFNTYEEFLASQGNCSAPKITPIIMYLLN